jgi:hypothetical protein
MSNTSHAIRQGWLYDPECHRTTYRRQAAMNVLRALGAAPEEREHDADCWRHPSYLRGVAHSYKGSVACSCGRDRDPYIWRVWVTDELIDAAYRAADIAQTQRGEWHQQQINTARRERAAP